mmetsp:Transcript_28478/g.67991  ORF Transcript_28478/g.67991 Transcript_28478/m.67991 type:complete len:278 (-) Transcript_28478:523-1356(-)
MVRLSLSPVENALRSRASLSSPSALSLSRSARSTLQSLVRRSATSSASFRIRPSLFASTRASNAALASAARRLSTTMASSHAWSNHPRAASAWSTASWRPASAVAAHSAAASTSCWSPAQRALRRPVSDVACLPWVREAFSSLRRLACSRVIPSSFKRSCSRSCEARTASCLNVSACLLASPSRFDMPSSASTLVASAAACARSLSNSSWRAFFCTLLSRSSSATASLSLFVASNSLVNFSTSHSDASMSKLSWVALALRVASSLVVSCHLFITWLS